MSESPKVRMYATQVCPYCVRAEQLLRRKEAQSQVADFTTGRFEPVLPDLDGPGTSSPFSAGGIGCAIRVATVVGQRCLLKAVWMSHHAKVRIARPHQRSGVWRTRAHHLPSEASSKDIRNGHGIEGRTLGVVIRLFS